MKQTAVILESVSALCVLQIAQILYNSFEINNRSNSKYKIAPRSLWL